MSDQPLRIAIADDERDTREFLLEALPRLGYQVIAAGSGAQLVQLCQHAPPDLVITDIKMADVDGIDAVLAINQMAPTPAILLSAHHEDELVRRAAPPEANVMSYLLKPIGLEDLKTAIPLAVARFRHLRGLVEETAGLKQQLEDRKLIERAKGIVMKRLRLDEGDTFRRMRVLASSQNRKLVEVCRQIAAAEEVFGHLEGIAVPSR